MYFQTGSYVHSANEVLLTSLNIQRMYSPRNTLVFMRHTLALQGHFCVTGQSSIKAAIQEMEEAYKVLPGGVNGAEPGHSLDAGLYHDDGTVSAHFLDASKAINGVRLQRLGYSNEEGGEYATGRTYNIVLQADYLNPEEQIYSFSESVQFIGNCGPQWELVPQFYGPPQLEVVAEQTVQRIIQSGTAIGIEAPPYIPAELLPANYKHGEQSFWEHGSADMIGVHQNLLFPSKWRYVFSSVSKLDFYPHPDFPGH